MRGRSRRWRGADFLLLRLTQATQSAIQTPPAFAAMDVNSPQRPQGCPGNLSRLRACGPAEPRVAAWPWTTAPLRPRGASRGEREGPVAQRREGEVGTRLVRPPHPALSPRPAGGEGKKSVPAREFESLTFARIVLSDSPDSPAQAGARANSNAAARPARAGRERSPRQREGKGHPGSTITTRPPSR